MDEIKFDLYKQMLPKDRAVYLWTKYNIDYLKWIINGMIKQYRKSGEQKNVDYWFEVANEIKKIKQ